MTEAPSENLDMTIVLPLGVVANQLLKIEAELRLLGMKALDFANERDNAVLAGRIEARLDNINEALDSIRNLVSVVEERVRQSSPDAVYWHANRKPPPDRDD